MTYETVDPLRPEIQKKVDLAFDILFDAVLREEQEIRPFSIAAPLAPFNA